MVSFICYRKGKELFTLLFITCRTSWQADMLICFNWYNKYYLLQGRDYHIWLIYVTQSGSSDERHTIERSDNSDECFWLKSSVKSVLKNYPVHRYRTMSRIFDEVKYEYVLNYGCGCHRVQAVAKDQSWIFFKKSW